MTFYDTDDIAIGSTIGSSTGISSSGNVILSSGADESVGTTTGGNITISGDPTISSSSGNVKLYSGSIDGSTGVTTLVGSGSGNFRYNSDETTTNFTTALGSTGIYAIYREQPSVSGTISSGTITYGDANPSFSLSGGSGLENGDSSSGFTIASSSYSTANKLEASASAYTVNASGLANLGYNISSITNGSLTVNQKTLSVADLAAQDKEYDGSDSATLSNAGTLSGKVTGDAVTFATTATFNNKNVENTKTLNLDYTLSGDDKDNYTLSDATEVVTSADITAKEVTLSASKTYDGTTDLTGDVTITTGVGSETLTYSNATSNDAHVATTNKYINAITLADGENNGLASNYALPTLNNANAAVTINAATLTPTISNTGVTKTYDGTTNAPSGFTPTYTFAGLVSGDTVAALNYTGAAYDDKDVADVTKITLSGLSINSITGTNDSLASDYVLDTTSKEVSALITKADLEVSGLIAQDKTYDALQTATLSGTASVTVFGSDDVTLGGTAAGTFDDKNVGTSKVVTVTGNTISGSDAVNYNLVQQGGLTADIIKKDLTVTAADRTKVYGSSFTLGSSDFTSDGLVNSETIGSVTLNSANSYAASTTQDVSTYSNEIQISNAVDGTFDISNYDVTYEAGDLDITKKALSVNYLGTNKTYDGTDVVNVSGTLSGIINSDTVTLSQTAAFDNVNVGNDRDISISSIALSGVDADNYSITSTSSTTADISKAALTVTANDDAKFVTQNDSTFTASYAGFVNAETSSILGGTLAITRTNSGTDTAGTYNDVLEASGYTSNNYDISYENGNFIIVPADELLVKVINVSNAYGTATQYALNSVEYYNSNDSSVVTLGSGGSTTSIDGDNLVSINDGAGGTASFTISPQNNTTSTAGKLEVGSYQLGIDGLVTENSNNFSDTVTIVGAHEVTQKSLTASASNVSKVYDGNTSMNGVTIGLDTLETNDVVSVDGSGAFSSKNQGTGLSYTVNNLVLAGTDASNYYLSGGTSFSGSNGVITKKDLSVSYTATDKTYDGSTTATVTESTNDIVSGDSVSISETSVFTDKNVGTNKTVNITSIALSGDDAGNYNLTNIDQEANTTASISRLDSVTWIGGASGNWFDPSNWAGGAVPDLSNVANVVIPTGTVVSFDTTGSVSPADSTSAVNIDSLGTLGSLNMTNGVLNVQDSITLDTFTQNGGTLTAEDFTVTNEYSQGTSGSVVVSGDTDITDNSNGTVIGNLETTGTTTITSTDGDITQANGTTSEGNGLTTLNAGSNDIILNEATNDFVTLNATGKDVTIKDTNDLTVSLTSSGDSTLTIGGDLEVDGTTNNLTTITTNNGTTTFGATTVNGTLSSTSDGDISQESNTSLDVLQTTTFNASSNNVNLDNASNNFQSTVNITGATVAVKDSLGGIELGNINTSGSLNVTSINGDITQAINTAVVSSDTFTANSGSSDLILNNSNNDFETVNAQGRNITLKDRDTLIASLTASGDSTLTAGGNLRVDGTTNNLTTITTNSGTTTFGDLSTSINGNLNTLSDGNILQVQELTVNGTSVLNAGSNNVILDNSSNDFQSSVTTTGRNVSLVRGRSDNTLNNILTPIINNTIISKTPKTKVNTFSRNKSINSNITVKSNNNANVVSQPTNNQNITMVSMNELKLNNSDSNGNTVSINEDIRVPVEENSVIELVNGGINLPTGVDQLLFVINEDQEN